MYFTVEEENMIGMYHKSARRRTAGAIQAVLPEVNDCLLYTSTADTMKIERRIYFESGKSDLSELVKLPLAELLSLRAESAAAEQEVFDLSLIHIYCAAQPAAVCGCRRCLPKRRKTVL